MSAICQFQTRSKNIEKNTSSYHEDKIRCKALDLQLAIERKVEWNGVESAIRGLPRVILLLSRTAVAKQIVLLWVYPQHPLNGACSMVMVD